MKENERESLADQSQLSQHENHAIKILTQSADKEVLEVIDKVKSIFLNLPVSDQRLFIVTLISILQGLENE